MRLRILAIALLACSTGVSLAQSGRDAGELAAAAGGVAGTAVAINSLIGNTSRGSAYAAAAAAPEISTSGAAEGLALLLGGALVLRERKRLRA